MCPHSSMTTTTSAPLCCRCCRTTTRGSSIDLRAEETGEPVSAASLVDLGLVAGGAASRPSRHGGFSGSSEARRRRCGPSSLSGSGEERRRARRDDRESKKKKMLGPPMCGTKDRGDRVFSPLRWFASFFPGDYHNGTEGVTIFIYSTNYPHQIASSIPLVHFCITGFT
jgi:hypothetical protein